MAVAPKGDTLTTTISGEDVKPLYTAADLPELEAIGVPGQYPYTRGVYESMYRGRLAPNVAAPSLGAALAVLGAVP